MNRETASELIQAHGINATSDYHALSSDQVERVLCAADAVKYRKPRNANGSRARYFYTALCRAINRKTP